MSILILIQKQTNLLAYRILSIIETGFAEFEINLFTKRDSSAARLP